MRLHSIALDVGHGPRGSSYDVGARHAVVDEEGRTEDVYERWLTPHFAQGLEDGARELGVDVYRVPQHPAYSHRHSAASAWAQKVDGLVIFIQSHLNAGAYTARYGLVGWDRRSDLGESVARHWTARAGASAEELGVSKVLGLAFYDDRAEPRPWKVNGWYCIRGVGDPGTPANLCGLLWEPAFLHQVATMGVDGWRTLGRLWAAHLPVDVEF